MTRVHSWTTPPRCPYCNELYPLAGSTVLIAGRTWHTRCREEFLRRLQGEGS